MLILIGRLVCYGREDLNFFDTLGAIDRGLVVIPDLKPAQICFLR